MIQIRQGMFETNSSSVHALVIPKDQNINIPKSISMYLGEYGWEEDTVTDTASYLYTACKDMGDEEVEKLVNYLKSRGVEYIHCQDDIDWFYVDHCNDIPFEELFGNSNLLDRFLFGEESFVQTGNDNSGHHPCKEDYDLEKNDVLIKYN